MRKQIKDSYIAVILVNATSLFVYDHCGHFAHSHLEWAKQVDYFKYVGMRMNIWIKVFEIVRFKIKIIFCEIKKKSKMTFYCS